MNSINVGPDFWRLVFGAAVIIALCVVVNVVRTRHQAPANRDRRRRASIARAEQLLAAAEAKYGGPHHA